MHPCLPFIKCVLVYVTPWGYKRLSVHIKDCSGQKMNGTLYQKENGLRQQGSCFNKVLMWRGATMLCDPCKTYQTRHLFCWGLWCSRVMFLIFYQFLLQTHNYFMTDLRPFYRCMLKTIISECRNHGYGCLCSQNPQWDMCIWTLFSFENWSEVFLLK